MEHETDGNTICNWCTWNRPQSLAKCIRIVWNGRMNQDHPKYSIVKIGQTTVKSPGDLWRLAVIQSPIKDHHLTLTIWAVSNEQHLSDRLIVDVAVTMKPSLPHGLFNAKAILVEEHSMNYRTHNWRRKQVHTFPNGISPKVERISATNVWTHMLRTHSLTCQPLSLVNSPCLYLWFNISGVHFLLKFLYFP